MGTPAPHRLQRSIFLLTNDLVGLSLVQREKRPPEIRLRSQANALYNSVGNQHCPNHYFTIIVQQIKSSQMLVFDERGKTSQSRVEDQRIQSTYDAECGPQWWNH